MNKATRRTCVALTLSVLAAAPVAFGQKMYKCSDGKGGTVFQQSPCGESAQEAEARSKERERIEAEAAKKKEDEARKKAENIEKAKERDKAFLDQEKQRVEERKKVEEAERRLMQGTSGGAGLPGAFDGSLPSSVENIYPAPWKTDLRTDIASTLGKKQIQGCNKFRYRQRLGGLNEYVVQCTPDGGTNWVTYFVWPGSDGIRGPAKF